MKKSLVAAFCSLLAFSGVHAQSKVFKEVNDDCIAEYLQECYKWIE